ncbi:hypothetical protein KJ680_14295, partial [bacterium]|nr:hypothetical protein [bacterium]
MKKIFNKYKILIITSIIIILAGTTVIVLSQWSPPYAIIPLSTDHVSPQGRYDIISARQYFDLDDPTYMLDPTGESFVKDIRAQEITCAEIRGVIHGRTDRDLDGTGKNRYVMFHSTTGIPAVVPPYCDALLYTLNVEQDINVGGTYDYDGDGTRDLYYDYKKDDGSN